jgi:hypothetical protein
MRICSNDGQWWMHEGTGEIVLFEMQERVFPTVVNEKGSRGMCTRSALLALGFVLVGEYEQD